MTQVMIAVPSHDTVNVRWAGDLARLYALSAASLMGAVDLNMVVATYVHDARERLATEAVDAGATHVLWVDSDMRFPRDALLRLLAHRLDAVGVNYSTRETPGRFTAKSMDGLERLATTPDSRGLEEVVGMGFGLLLMRTTVLTRTQTLSGAPLFRYDWMPDRGLHLGEDYSFCLRAGCAGFRFYVDHDLSRECAHIGAFEYRTENALQPEAVP